MKIRCSRAVLASAVQTVSAVVPSRTPRDILKRIRFSADESSAALMATDQETSIRVVVPELETLEPGDVLLPTAEVSQILREMQDEGIDLESDENRITIRGAHSKFRLPAVDPAEYPVLPDVEAEQCFAVQSASLRKAIRRTLFAIEAEGSRYALGGVLFAFNAEPKHLVATDSRRLALANIECVSSPENAVLPETPLVPAKALQLLDRTINDQEDAVQVSFRSNEVLFRTGSTTIVSRLIEGRFPKYSNVIPQSLEHTVELVNGPFYSAVRQAQIVTDEETRSVTFHFLEGTLALHSAGVDTGESDIELPISYSGPEQQIAFDPSYLVDLLRVLDAETTIQLNFTDHSHPALFRIGDEYLYVLMPLAQNEQ